MKLMLISDLHGAVSQISKIEETAKSCDAVLFAGDFAEFNKEETGLPALEALLKINENIFAVNGNCDKSDFLENYFAEHQEKDNICVEKSIVNFEGLMITGCGGGTKFTGTTPNERDEEEILSDLNLVDASSGERWDNLVVIMHNPPKDTECDKVNPEVHVGSAALKEFIEKVQPLLVVTGHIHESAGKCKIGETLVVNPGPLAEGNYVIVDVQKENGKWIVVE